MSTIAGYNLIVPSSVVAGGVGSSASISATGEITYTSCDTVSVNGCFTSTYDNYIIQVNGVGTGGMRGDIQMRASGTDDTSTNYTVQYYQASNTTINAGREGGTTNRYVGVIDQTNANYNSVNIMVFGPNIAQNTVIRGIAGPQNAATPSILERNAGVHTVASAYDGFTFLCTFEKGTGKMRIYGLAQ